MSRTRLIGVGLVVLIATICLDSLGSVLVAIYYIIYPCAFISKGSLALVEAYLI